MSTAEEKSKEDIFLQHRDKTLIDAVGLDAVKNNFSYLYEDVIQIMKEYRRDFESKEVTEEEINQCKSDVEYQFRLEYQKKTV